MADINLVAERLRALGPVRYAISAFIHILRGRSHNARLIVDNQVPEDDFMFVAACNTKYTGKDMLLAPRAKINDGVFDVIVVRRAARFQLLNMLSRVFDGSHLELPGIEYYQVRSMSIETPGTDVLNLDGEIKGTTPVTAEIMPAALRILA